MSDIPFQKEIDPNPLVTRLIEKSKDGKLKWEPTAEDGVFVTSLGGETTIKLSMQSVESADFYGNPEYVSLPVLNLFDQKGRRLWTIESSQVKGGLAPLYTLAARIGNRVDERMTSLLEALDKI